MSAIFGAIGSIGGAESARMESRLAHRSPRVVYAPDSLYADEVAMRIWTAILTEVWARRFLDERGARPEGIEG